MEDEICFGYKATCLACGKDLETTRLHGGGVSFEFCCGTKLPVLTVTFTDDGSPLPFVYACKALVFRACIRIKSVWMRYIRGKRPGQ